MSQIGYMVVGVSIGAYVGGLFHLMTHAFFKALLFMAAGSVIGGDGQCPEHRPDERLSARDAAHLGLLIVGALALAAFPFTSGFFSKDEILAFAADRGGMYLIFTIGGYVGALMTAIYAFRIGSGWSPESPCEEARELEQGHLHHAEPRNPATGEVEDTDVGFPGSEHQIAERRRPMAIAMSVLADRSAVRRGGPDPGRHRGARALLPRHLRVLAAVPHRALDRRLLARPADRRRDQHRRDRDRLLLLRRPPGSDRATDRAFRRRAPFLLHKWYFDELQDALVYRPRSRSAGSPTRSSSGWSSTGSSLSRPEPPGRGSVVRDAQSGFVRAYALLLVGGFAALGVYFLVVSSRC